MSCMESQPPAAELFIGTLSGTSVDGIDAALVRFGERPELVATHSLAFPPELKAELLALGRPGDNEIDRLGRADVTLGRLFARAVNELLAKAGVASAAVRAVGSHGQTIRHRPGFDPAFTLQIGDPNVIAAESGITVVADFRRKDLALGGQGAPLVPAFHETVFRTKENDRVIVNLGGIANLTALPADPTAPILGFDTGPANTLLDAWARRVLGTPMDRDGALAARGHVVPGLLRAMLAEPFFGRPAPKSTGPEQFSTAWLETHLARLAAPPSDADVQATLVALTARSVADAIRALPGMGARSGKGVSPVGTEHGRDAHATPISDMGGTPMPPRKAPEVFVCGGGARNPALMRALQEELPLRKVAPTDALGVAGDWVEALAFAWLARQHVLGLPGNCPRVTGASRAAVLGAVFLPE
ncbi:MAG: anhydro-N-acetylmuramic acid kinase [Opitutaceae bacterium]|nr:anhydro-N-acetylmuramic acid kinase [Opitutaceae bacterium]